MNLKTRNISYDIIRIVALMMIVMVHVSAYIVIFYPHTDKPEWLVGNLFNGLARAGVPMFIMLSGALLLKEDKAFDTKKFYRKSLLTMVILTLGWMAAYGVFYSVILPLGEGRDPSLADFWGYILSFRGSDYPHLWYMLMVVGMYLMIPVLRLFVKRENKAYIVGAIIVSLVYQFGVTTANLLTRDAAVSLGNLVGKLHLEPATGFLGLLLLGWYLGEYSVKKKTLAILCSLGAIAAVMSTVAVYFLIDTIPNIRDYMFEALTLPPFVYAAAVFAVIKYLAKEKNTSCRLIATLSECSFGVYLVHVMVMEVFVRFVLPYEVYGTGRPLSYILILYVFTLGVSLGIVYVAGRIKGIRRIFFNHSLPKINKKTNNI